MTILTPETSTPRCTCVVDLLSKHFRPYNFLVTVSGEPPHAVTRRYRIAAPTEDEAAIFGMQLFVREFMPNTVNDGMAKLAPKATLQ